MTKHLTYMKPKPKEETEEILMSMTPDEVYELWVWGNSWSQGKVYHHVMEKMRETKRYGSKKLLKMMDAYYKITH